MRKLALSDDILLSIEKPARYIGGEVNSVMKDKHEVDIRFAMICLTVGRMCGVNVFILHGWISTK